MSNSLWFSIKQEFYGSASFIEDGKSCFALGTFFNVILLHRFLFLIQRHTFFCIPLIYWVIFLFFKYRVSFLTGAPLNFLRKISIQSLALREIMSQITWDLVLREFRGAPVKKTPEITLLYSSALICTPVHLQHCTVLYSGSPAAVHCTVMRYTYNTALYCIRVHLKHYAVLYWGTPAMLKFTVLRSKCNTAIYWTEVLYLTYPFAGSLLSCQTIFTP